MEVVDQLEQKIFDGEAVNRFLNDSTIKRVFAGIDERYYHLWKAAETAEEREALWAKARGIDDLGVALQAVADAGTIAKLEVEKRQTQQS